MPFPLVKKKKGAETHQITEIAVFAIIPIPLISKHKPWFGKRGSFSDKVQNHADLSDSSVRYQIFYELIYTSDPMKNKI